MHILDIIGIIVLMLSFGTNGAPYNSGQSTPHESIRVDPMRVYTH